MDRRDALDALPEAYRLALGLRDDGVAPARIAELLRLDPDTITGFLEIGEAKLGALIREAPAPQPARTDP